MKLNLYLFYIINSFIFSSNLELENEKLIISITSKFDNLNFTNIIIESILSQKPNHSTYKIILILSKKEIKDINILPKSILFLEKYNKIRIILIDEDINLQTRLIIAIKEYPKNPILIINDDAIFPEGWLEMFINDHKNYPNDIISGSIQYFIDKNLNVKILSEGYKGKNFGTFNHITNIIFNFAFVNTNLGGTLYPPNTFRNKDFFDYQLFKRISINSDEFWQSCFIMMENKILRQSSKIYDYTQYLISKDQQAINKEISFKKNLIKFCKCFPKFRNIVERRQKQILISLTSYKERFDFLPTVINSLKSQSITPNKIVLVLAEKDMNSYDLKIEGLDIININKDLRSHNKYYYAMLKYPEYAIVTVDDDIIYCKNMLESLYNSYIDHPNIVSGRRGHLMRYKKNGELESYYSWNMDQKSIIEADYNIFLTGVGGVLYPPDVFNINEQYSKIIEETMTADDIALKYYEVMKGIDEKWVPNNHALGLKIMTNLMHRPLGNINSKNNDIYIKNINIDIKNIILENLCVNYKNISTGLTIYLFNINNINKNSNITLFNIDAYSYCPIDNNIRFEIYFNNDKNHKAYCYFNSNFSLIKENHKIFKTNKILKAICNLNATIDNFNDFYFPKAFSEKISNLKIYNYYKYIPYIFKSFILIKETNRYILRTFFFKSFDKGYNLSIKINKTKFVCRLYEDVIYSNNKQPILQNFKCDELKDSNNNAILEINKIHKNLTNCISLDDIIPNQFIISKIYNEFINNNNYIIFKGKLFDDLKFDLYNLKIFPIYPNISLNCFIKSTNKNIQAYIYCNIGKENFSQILINNQIIYSGNCNESLLLINKEIFYQNYQIIKNIAIDNYIIKKKKIILKKAFHDIDYIIYIILSFFFIIKVKYNKKIIMNIY